MMEGLALLLLIAFFVAGFIYADRLERSGAARDWAIAWVLLYGSSITTEGPLAAQQLPHALGHTMGTLCFAFLARGAFRFTERPPPAWLLPAAVVIALGRAGLALQGLDEAVWLIGLSTEIPLISLLAWLIWRHATDSKLERTLASSSALIGLASLSHSISSLMGKAPEIIVALYLAAAVAMAMLQLASVLERVRNREQLLLAQHAAQTRELDALVEAVPAGIMMVGKRSEIRRLNRRLADIAGIEDRSKVMGVRGREVILPTLARMDEASQQRFKDRWAELDRSDEPDLADFEVRALEPEERILMISASQVRAEDGERLGRVWATRDVTEERLLSERLYRAQRMETLGTLTGGVAHDFNNQLTAILGNARLVSQRLASDHEMREPLADVVQSAERCAELTRGLLTFSRQSQPVVRSVDIATVLREVESVIRPSLPPDVRLEVDSAPGLPALEADPTQLVRALTNLAVNARDAVGESGLIRIEAALAAAPQREPRGIEIVVADSGVGMDARLRERIFDPFFTTKPVGQGTGLGLAIVYGIVESHGATLEVESEPGQGTRFRLIWPASGSSEEHLETVEAAEPIAPAAANACILVAEDEESVRRLVARTLELLGHRVLATKDGREALAVFRERSDEITLVLVDLSMPRMNGADTIRAVRAIRPDVPAVLMTGHLDRGKAAGPLEGVPIVMKPFGVEELSEAIRAALSDDQDAQAGVDADRAGDPT